jgi:hypothetical protein
MGQIYKVRESRETLGGVAKIQLRRPRTSLAPLSSIS